MPPERLERVRVRPVCWSTKKGSLCSMPVNRVPPKPEPTSKPCDTKTTRPQSSRGTFTRGQGTWWTQKCPRCLPWSIHLQPTERSTPEKMRSLGESLRRRPQGRSYLGSGQRHARLGEVGLELVEDRRAKPSRNVADHTLDNAAHLIKQRRRVVNK